MSILLVLLIIIFIAIVYIYTFIKAKKQRESLKETKIGFIEASNITTNKYNYEPIDAEDDRIIVDYIDKEQLYKEVQAEVNGKNNNENLQNIKFKF